MTKIFLIDADGRNHTALVDQEDHEMVKQFNWSVHQNHGIFYAISGGGRSGGSIYMHRLILGLKRYDGKYVDHINGNGLDNRRCNLQVIPQRGNILKANTYKNATGVQRTSPNGRWRARARVDGVQYRFGGFDTKEEAIEYRRRFINEIERLSKIKKASTGG